METHRHSYSSWFSTEYEVFWVNSAMHISKINHFFSPSDLLSFSLLKDFDYIQLFLITSHTLFSFMTSDFLNVSPITDLAFSVTFCHSNLQKALWKSTNGLYLIKVIICFLVLLFFISPTAFAYNHVLNHSVFSHFP